MRYQIDYNNSLYIILSKSVFVGQDDLESMMNYVGNGNTLLISAEYIDRKLIDTLGVELNDMTSQLPVNEYNIKKRDTWLSLIQEPLPPKAINSNNPAMMSQNAKYNGGCFLKKAIRENSSSTLVLNR